jgi:hypothetical protein
MISTIQLSEILSKVIKSTPVLHFPAPKLGEGFEDEPNSDADIPESSS